MNERSDERRASGCSGRPGASRWLEWSVKMATVLGREWDVDVDSNRRRMRETRVTRWQWTRGQFLLQGKKNAIEINVYVANVVYTRADYIARERLRTRIVHLLVKSYSNGCCQSPRVMPLWYLARDSEI